MERYARLAPATGPARIVDVQRPRGFFDALDEHFADVTPTRLTPLQRICSQARRHLVRSLVIEEIEAAEELHEENHYLEEVGQFAQRHRVRRLSFFCDELSEDSLCTVPESSFIGYVIWKDDGGASASSAMSRVYEATIKPPAGDYLHFRTMPTRQCRVGGRTFSVEGFPFFQQNGITNTCAHASLRTLAASFGGPDRDVTFAEITEMAGLPKGTNFRSTEVGGGLLVEQIKEVVRKLGAACISLSYQPEREKEKPEDKDEVPTIFNPPDKLPHIPYQRLVYGSLESGYPAIVVFGTDEPVPTPDPEAPPKVTWDGNGLQVYRHAVTVFGHTFNRDMYLPRIEVARFELGEILGHIPSDYWTGSFVGHDDVLGPYYSVPRHYMRSMLPSEHDHPRLISYEGVAHVIGTLPRLCRLRSFGAETVALAWLNDRATEFYGSESPWLKRFLEQHKKRHLVLRPILISRTDYLAHLQRITGWDHSHADEAFFDQMTNALPADEFWMIEISVQELFPTNKRKLGELLVDSSLDFADTESQAGLEHAVMVARLPGVWATRGNAFVPSPITSHTELFGCEGHSPDQGGNQPVEC